MQDFGARPAGARLAIVIIALVLCGIWFCSFAWCASVNIGNATEVVGHTLLRASPASVNIAAWVQREDRLYSFCAISYALGAAAMCALLGHWPSRRVITAVFFIVSGMVLVADLTSHAILTLKQQYLFSTAMRLGAGGFADYSWDLEQLAEYVKWYSPLLVAGYAAICAGRDANGAAICGFPVSRRGSGGDGL